MGVLVVLLVVTNLVTLAVLGWWLLRPSAVEEPDEVVSSALDGAPRPTGSLGVRRLITIEILNPIELAGTRGRVAGIAGSLVPGITRRVVYDQALRRIRRDMREQHVIADVRMHTIRPASAPAPATPLAPRREGTADNEPAPSVPVYFDEIRRLDLDDLEDRGA